MHRIVTGILVLLLLYFAADHARLQDRNRFLEEKLAARAARPTRRAPVPETTPAPAAEVPLPDPATIPDAPSTEPVPSPAPASTLTPLVELKAVFRGNLAEAEALAKNVEDTFRLVTKGNPFDALNLSESQKASIEALVAQRDRQIAAQSEGIEAAREAADRAILGVLTPEQQARYRPQTESATFTLSPDPVVEAPAAVPPHGFLGVTGANAAGGGVTFTDIIPDTAASGAGLLAGDVLLEFNDQKVTDYFSLVGLIRAQPQGSPVNLKIRRNGAEFTQAVLLGARR